MTLIESDSMDVVAHPTGCGCQGCGLRDQRDTNVDLPSSVFNSNGLDAASLQTMANYLREGYWTEPSVDWYSFSWNMGSSGSNPNSGVLHYNLTGFDFSDVSWINRADSNGITNTGRVELIRESFKLFEEVLGIEFVETTSTDRNEVDMFFSDNRGGASASTYINTSSQTSSFSFINVNAGWSGGASDYNTYTLQTILHEIGHALGLGHQGLYNGSGSYPNNAKFANDSWQATMMSYFSQSENGTVIASREFLQTPMAVDWIALQDIYGEQSFGTTEYGIQNAFNGDTIYGFNTNISSQVSEIWANYAEYGNVSASTIIDGSGNDTLDVSGYGANQRIDLTPTLGTLTQATTSDIGGRIGNLTLAEGTTIENAVGGSGDDRITGNAANNLLIGNQGDDTIDGALGQDTIEGGLGTDTLVIDAVRSSVSVEQINDDAWSFALGGGTRYFTEGVEFLAFSDQTVAIDTLVAPAPAPLPPTRGFEVGQTTFTQNAEQWTRVSFDRAIEDAVVVIGGITGGGRDHFSLRTRDVTETGFEFQLDEWDYLDGWHAEATISWMAGTSGSHQLSDGTIIQLGETTLNDAYEQRVDVEGIGSVSSVFATLSHTADEGRTHRLMTDAEGFDFQVQAEEERGGSDAPKPDGTLSWAAVNLFQSEADHGVAEVDHNRTGLGQSVDQSEAFFAQMQTMRGIDPAITRTDVANGVYRTWIDEEKSADSEIVHGRETVDWLALDVGRQQTDIPDPIETTRGFEIGQTTFVQNAGQWHRVTFDGPIDDAVVVIGGVMGGGGDDFSLRTRDVTDTGFEFQLDEWDYLDGWHAQATISWMAGSSGSHQLSNGTIIHLGETTLNDSVEQRVNVDGIDTVSSVFATLSHTGGGGRTHRLMTDDEGFDFQVQAEEERGGSNAPKPDGTLSWAAIDVGQSTADHGVAQVNHTKTALNQSADENEALFAQMQTVRGVDPAMTRTEVVDGVYRAWIDEEKSADREVWHGNETVDWIALEVGRYSVAEVGNVDVANDQSVGLLGSAEIDPNDASLV